MLRTLVILLLASTLTACATIPNFGRDDVDPITINTQATTRTPLAITDPDPLRVDPVTWYVITAKNQAEIFKRLQAQGLDPVLFGITDDGYADLSRVMIELRAYITQQREILRRYREYYEPDQERQK